MYLIVNIVIIWLLLGAGALLIAIDTLYPPFYKVYLLILGVCVYAVLLLQMYS